MLPGHNHGISRAEDIAISTGPVQRLRRLRQMGLAYCAYPLAEHTRFSHSLGTVYWALKMLRGLQFSKRQLAIDNQRVLSDIGRVLGSTLSLELLIRLYALTYDVALLPLGHTLRIQIEQLHNKQTFQEAFGLALRWIHADARSAQLDCARVSPAEWQVFERHLALVEAVAHAPRLLIGEALNAESLAECHFTKDELHHLLPVVTFVYDLTHGVYAADLIDLCGRDLPAIGGHWSLPESLFDAGAAIVAAAHTPAFPTDKASVCESIFRYGIDCRDNGSPGLSALYHLAAVHRARLEVVQAGVYASRKCVADAMLEKAMRKLEATDPTAIDQLGSLSDLLKMGDDEFLARLQSLLQPSRGRELMIDLQRGQLFEPALVVDALTAPEELLQLAKLANTPAQRTILEAELARAGGVPEDSIIVTILPEDMQGKVPTTLVAVGSHGWQPIDRLARTSGLVPDLASLYDQYRDLRRFLLLLHPRALHKSAFLSAYCLECAQRASETGLSDEPFRKKRELEAPRF